MRPDELGRGAACVFGVDSGAEVPDGTTQARGRRNELLNRNPSPPPLGAQLISRLQLNRLALILQSARANFEMEVVCVCVYVCACVRVCVCVCVAQVLGDQRSDARICCWGRKGWVLRPPSGSTVGSTVYCHGLNFLCECEMVSEERARKFSFFVSRETGSFGIVHARASASCCWRKGGGARLLR